MYYFIWPLLSFIAASLGKVAKLDWAYAFLALIFGLSFGLIFAIFESFFYGFAYGLAYWFRGIPFDLVHGASNFIITLILFKPLYKLLVMLRDQNNYTD